MSSCQSQINYFYQEELLRSLYSNFYFEPFIMSELQLNLCSEEAAEEHIWVNFGLNRICIVTFESKTCTYVFMQTKMLLHKNSICKFPHIFLLFLVPQNKEHCIENLKQHFLKGAMYLSRSNIFHYQEQKISQQIPCNNPNNSQLSGNHHPKIGMIYAD